MTQPRNLPNDTSARQLSEYKALREAVDTVPSLNYDICRRMAQYLGRYGNVVPAALRREGVSAAFSTEQVEKAYYASDAYARRAARSLGYAPGQVMRAADKAVYDRMLERGRNASVIDVVHDDTISDEDSYFIDCVLEDYNFETGEVTGRIEEHTAFIGEKDADKGRKVPLDMDTMGHEMGHFLYTGHDDDLSLNPGQKGRTNYNGQEEQQYGKPGSPLRTINANPSREAVLRRNLRLMAENYTEEERKDMQQDNYRAAIKSSREHDDSGMERGADVHGVRMLMMQEGIWNFFSGRQVTLPQVLQFKKEHPTSRVFQYWTPQQVVYYLNNIAMKEATAKSTYADLAAANFEKIMQEKEEGRGKGQQRT